MGVALGLLLAFATPSAAKTDFPAPPGARVGVLSEQMSYNGIPMQVRQFKTRRSMDRVLDFYRRLWERDQGGIPGYVESDALPPWTILTRVEDDVVMTVQVAAEGGGAAGYLTMSRVPDADDLPERGEDFPAMRGSIFYNDIKSTDRGKRGRTLQLSNLFNLRGNVNFYRNYYRDRGWSLLVDRAMSEDMHTLAFKKGSETVTVVVTRAQSGESVVMAQTMNEGW